MAFLLLFCFCALNYTWPRLVKQNIFQVWFVEFWWKSGFSISSVNLLSLGIVDNVLLQLDISVWQSHQYARYCATVSLKMSNPGAGWATSCKNQATQGAHGLVLHVMLEYPCVYALNLLHRWRWCMNHERFYPGWRQPRFLRRSSRASLLARIVNWKWLMPFYA